MTKIDRNGYSSRIDYKIFGQMLNATEMPKYTLLWNLLYYTGARISAALSLRRCDCYVDYLPRESIVFRSANLKRSGGIQQPSLEVPIALPLKTYLQAYWGQFKREDSEWLFEGIDKYVHLSRSAADKHFRIIMKRIRKDRYGYSIHGFKRNFMLLLHEHNASFEDIKRLSGNKNLSSIQKYLQQDENRSKQLIDSIF